MDNGIFLSPTIDALFDKYSISFEHEGFIIIEGVYKQKEIRSFSGFERDVFRGLKRYQKVLVKASKKMF